jgi:hypothetical protein
MNIALYFTPVIEFDWLYIINITQFLSWIVCTNWTNYYYTKKFGLIVCNGDGTTLNSWKRPN